MSPLKPMHVDPCRESDLGAVVELYSEWMASGATPEMSIPSEDYLRREVEKCFFLVRDENGVVGFVHGAVRHFRDENQSTIPFNEVTLVLEGLYVSPRRRGDGIGDALLCRSLEWAKLSGIGYAKLDIAVGDAERILSFYERFGFSRGKTERKL